MLCVLAFCLDDLLQSLAYKSVRFIFIGLISGPRLGGLVMTESGEAVLIVSPSTTSGKRILRLRERDDWLGELVKAIILASSSE